MSRVKRVKVPKRSSEKCWTAEDVGKQFCLEMEIGLRRAGYMNAINPVLVGCGGGEGDAEKYKRLISLIDSHKPLLVINPEL